MTKCGRRLSRMKRKVTEVSDKSDEVQRGQTSRPDSGVSARFCLPQRRLVAAGRRGYLTYRGDSSLKKAPQPHSRCWDFSFIFP